MNEDSQAAAFLVSFRRGIPPPNPPNKLKLAQTLNQSSEPRSKSIEHRTLAANNVDPSVASATQHAKGLRPFSASTSPVSSQVHPYYNERPVGYWGAHPTPYYYPTPCMDPSCGYMWCGAPPVKPITVPVPAHEHVQTGSNAKLAPMPKLQKDFLVETHECPSNLRQNLNFQQIYYKNGRIGIYTPEERKRKVQRYLERRKTRVYGKNVRYTSRKVVADGRVRVRGRFVKVVGDGMVTAPASPTVVASTPTTVISKLLCKPSIMRELGLDKTRDTGTPTGVAELSVCDAEVEADSSLDSSPSYNGKRWPHEPSSLLVG